MTLEEYKKLNHLTYTELAEKVGLDRTLLCKYIKGDRVPTIQNARQMEIKTNGQVPVTVWFK